MDSVLTDLLWRERGRQVRAAAYFAERYKHYYEDSSKRITGNPIDKEVDFVCRRENGEYINLRTMQYTTQIIVLVGLAQQADKLEFEGVYRRAWS